jgi:hypothetical protein
LALNWIEGWGRLCSGHTLGICPQGLNLGDGLLVGFLSMKEKRVGVGWREREKRDRDREKLLILEQLESNKRCYWEIK